MTESETTVDFEEMIGKLIVDLGMAVMHTGRAIAHDSVANEGRCKEAWGKVAKRTIKLLREEAKR